MSSSMAIATETADDFARSARKRQWGYVGITFGLAIVAALLYVPTALDSLLPPLILILLLALPILMWRLPHLVLYGTYAAACAIETNLENHSDSLTDRIPFFWNVNTIFQIYAHVNFKAIPLNLFECFILLAGIFSLFRAVVFKNLTLRGGPLLIPFSLYLFWVVIAWGNGMVTGGDFKISLQETRAQFYLFIGYLMAFNLVKERRQINTLLLITIISLIIKGLLYTFRRYVTMAGQPLPDQGVGSHEEAFLFDAFMVLLLSFVLCGVYPRWQRVMTFAMPLIILGNLATNRRAATAAMVIVVPVLLLCALQGLPKRRKQAIIAIAILGTLGPLYYQAFKNSQSAIAQPARAIKSQFQPDERDASSNAYRDAENANQMATIRAYPLGYGYGKRFIHAVVIADISEVYDWWDILPHNQILWIWMRTGFQGFFCFWIMIAAIIIRACLTFRDPNLEMEERCVALFSLLVVGMLLIFGLLDLQLSNFRDMLFAATWIGVLARLPEIPKPEPSGGVLSVRAIPHSGKSG